MPPSPWLSALSTTLTYLTVMITISDQKISDSTPRMDESRHRHPVDLGECLPDRVERTCPDVPVDDAKGPDRQRQHSLDRALDRHSAVTLGSGSRESASCSL